MLWHLSTSQRLRRLGPEVCASTYAQMKTAGVSSGTDYHCGRITASSRRHERVFPSIQTQGTFSSKSAAAVRPSFEPWRLRENKTTSAPSSTQFGGSARGFAIGPASRVARTSCSLASRIPVLFCNRPEARSKHKSHLFNLRRRLVGYVDLLCQLAISACLGTVTRCPPLPRTTPSQPSLTSLYHLKRESLTLRHSISSLIGDLLTQVPALPEVIEAICNTHIRD
jgi:hypothetical protein